MLDLFQQFILPLFFRTTEENRLVNKMTLYVTREITTYIETQEGELVKEISKLESPKVVIYEGKVTVDPHKIREILSDPIGYPQSNPQTLEKAVTFEQKDMVSTVYDMIHNTLEGFTASSKIILNSISIFFGKPF